MKISYMWIVGRLIRAERRRSKFPQGPLCRELLASQSVYSRMENGKIMIRVDQLACVEALMMLEPGEIMVRASRAEERLTRSGFTVTRKEIQIEKPSSDAEQLVDDFKS